MVIIGDAVAGANFEHSEPLAVRQTVRDTAALGA
jgi:uroporphyrin-III C-methyltransferase/precorrin-2 dehydrogenase/sirohydrochlorin ferrochelatase